MWVRRKKVPRGCAAPQGSFWLASFTTLKTERTRRGSIYLETKRPVQREGNHDLRLWDTVSHASTEKGAGEETILPQVSS